MLKKATRQVKTEHRAPKKKFLSVFTQLQHETTYLYVMQHLSEDGALFPSVVLGSVLVAVCSQTLQAFTQTFTVLHLKLLQTFTRKYVVH